MISAGIRGEMADTPDLGSGAERHVGSSPTGCTKYVSLPLPTSGLKVWGGVLKEVTVAYNEYGAENTGDNVIYICHALTGDSKVAEWWPKMVGEGKTFDLNRFHVVCANVLGGCMGTTGPSSINPDTGKPYGSAFPKYAMSDAVDVFRLFLKTIGVKKLYALVGGSYGGMQVVDWMCRYPEEMERAVIIGASASMNTQALAYDALQKRVIVNDSEYHGGDYYEIGDGKGPKEGLSVARQIAHITYLSRDYLENKFHREKQENWVNPLPFGEDYQVESYFQYQGKKFVGRFDANSYLHIVDAMDRFDIARDFGSLEKAMEKVASKVMIFSLDEDVLFTVEQSKAIYEALKANGKDAEYHHVSTGSGHDQFLTHPEDLAKFIGEFLK